MFAFTSLFIGLLDPELDALISAISNGGLTGMPDRAAMDAMSGVCLAYEVRVGEPQSACNAGEAWSNLNCAAEPEMTAFRFE
ncbi:hypothetical protein [Rhodoligotrophos defluvii]|uniref:hypothetical protein n=1 Tax=Rhodoligotrophos defluvii TaxID=2561934 RepID=UPI0010C9C983|nr:hypothetical protein [Rhodoligotrophos defluvii]